MLLSEDNQEIHHEVSCCVDPWGMEATSTMFQVSSPSPRVKQQGAFRVLTPLFTIHPMQVFRKPLVAIRTSKQRTHRAGAPIHFWAPTLVSLWKPDDPGQRRCSDRFAFTLDLSNHVTDGIRLASAAGLVAASDIFYFVTRVAPFVILILSAIPEQSELQTCMRV